MGHQGPVSEPRAAYAITSGCRSSGCAASQTTASACSTRGAACQHQTLKTLVVMSEEYKKAPFTTVLCCTVPLVPPLPYDCGVFFCMLGRPILGFGLRKRLDAKVSVSFQSQTLLYLRNENAVLLRRDLPQPA